jgi:hypothetical protein
VQHWKGIDDVGFGGALRKAVDVWLRNPDRLTAHDLNALRVVNPDAATTAATDRVEPDDAAYDLKSSVERDVLLKQNMSRWTWVDFTLSR